MLHPFTIVLLALCLVFGALWIIERHRRLTLGKILTKKWSAQIEQVRLQLDKVIQPLYKDLKLVEQEFKVDHLDAFPFITELEPIENKQWNNQLTLLKVTVFRQQQLHQYLQRIAHRKEEELRAFNYTVSHDLKTPLNNALYFMDLTLMQRMDGKDLDLVNYIQQTKILLLEIRDMIDSIAAYAYADNVTLSLQEIDLGQTIQKIVRQLRQSTESYAHITVQVTEPLPVVYADTLLFRQALANLLSNAFKFTKYQPAPMVRIDAYETQGFIEIAIADNGAGIPLEGQAHIFQLFQTAHTRSSFEGSGAGLAIVKRILERHQGQISVNSEGPEKGATFYIRIPAKIPA